MAKRNASFYILCTIAVICLHASELLSKSNSFIVITNIASPVDSISIEELRDIYNGDRVFWKTGKRIRAARLSEDSPTYVEFVSEILGKSPTQFVQHWRHKLFSGKGLPPKVIDDAEKMIRYIEENEGSIGFIPTSKRLTSPKIKPVEILD